MTTNREKMRAALAALPTADDAHRRMMDLLMMDLLTAGASMTKDGKRVDPAEFYARPESADD